MGAPERVEVEWIDSEADSSWMPVEQALAEADEERLHRSCGYLLAATEEYVLVGLNYREESDGQKAMVADTIRIPRVVVRGVYPLQRKGHRPPRRGQRPPEQQELA
jgi:hypothetical protein